MVKVTSLMFLGQAITEIVSSLNSMRKVLEVKSLLNKMRKDFKILCLKIRLQ